MSKEAVVYTDGFKTYDRLVSVGYRKHYRVKHGENEFAHGHNHINGIETLWGLAKTRLAKFNSISKSIFYLHLKECEFRFNYRKHDIYNLLLKECRKKR